MIKYKYKIGDKILHTDGRIGTITDLEVSRTDNVDFSSYWVIYDKSVHPDEHPRNTWEESIRRKL